MSDNKLRCALIFRLEGTKTPSSHGGEAGDGIALSNLSPGPVVLLAKYDHASEYESHAGGGGGGLYGDKEKNYADAVGMVVGGDPPGGVSEEGAIGGFKVVQSDLHQVIYGADSDGMCEFFFACVWSIMNFLFCFVRVLFFGGVGCVSSGGVVFLNMCHVILLFANHDFMWAIGHCFAVAFLLCSKQTLLRLNSMFTS